MAPKPFAIVPPPNLARRTQTERSQYDRGCCAKDRTRVTPPSGKIDNPPRRRDVEADLRQISVAIGMRLSADLHQSDNGQKHDQIPSPSHDKIRAAFSAHENAQRNRCQY